MVDQIRKLMNKNLEAAPPCASQHVRRIHAALDTLQAQLTPAAFAALLPVIPSYFHGDEVAHGQYLAKLANELEQVSVSVARCYLRIA
jgi:hypothetical protein